MVHVRQSEYYAALNVSTKQTDSAPFIEFMLSSILETIINTATANTPQVTPQVKALLAELTRANSPLNRTELQKLLGLKDRESFRLSYLQPALTAGLIEMTKPDKPNSRLQAYRLSAIGRQLVSK
ncbi:Fic family protein [Arsukibacterium sp.]|uniref:Fic family protein n=1 Tax=Arsukibacterium sp. TaxID=1977258 RepID=UPI002FD99D36